MVAINRNILALLAASLCCMSASAQQIEPRIAGLEADSVYMKLLSVDYALTAREDSIAIVVESLRDVYRNNASESGSREKIISLENQLFELRARKASVVDSLNVIEQEWVVNNLGDSEAIRRETTTLVDASDDVDFIYENPNVKLNLSNVDYKNLIKAEEAEADAEALSNEFMVNYDNMLSLSRSYDSTPSQDEADDIRVKFESLSRANDEILSQLSDVWGYIYDNKSFAYSLLMEMLGFNDILQQEADLMRNAQAEISSIMGMGCNEVQLRYLIQKWSMVEFEALVAEQLDMPNIATKRRELSSMLKQIDKKPLAKLAIEERLFLMFEPIKFVSKPLYNSSNPVPETVIYEQGTIYRIFVGSFAEKQPVATFRNTAPLSHRVNEVHRHCYYIGGFETFEEATQAQAKLKKHGFRAPQIVIWQDGREHNLTKEPLELTTSYRVNIDTQTLPAGTSDSLQIIAPHAAISKVGTDKFVVTSLIRQGQVDSIVNQLSRLDPDLKVSVEKSETKLEF